MRLFAELFSGRISSPAEGKDCRPPTRRANLPIEAQRMLVHWRNEKICLPVGTRIESCCFPQFPRAHVYFLFSVQIDAWWLQFIMLHLSEYDHYFLYHTNVVFNGYLACHKIYFSPLFRIQVYHCINLVGVRTITFSLSNLIS